MTDEEYTEDQAEDTTQAEIKEAFDAAISAESDEDDVKLQMISAGATFKNVTRLYNQFMIDSGLAISKADRTQIVEDTLEGRDFDTDETFGDAVDALVEAVKGATERSAAALIRSYGKKNDLDVYSKPKGEGVARVSFASKFYDSLAANPQMTEQAANDYVMGEGENEDTSENVKRHISHYLNIWSLVNRIANAA